jgi:AraC-like DNA-binding protein
MQTSEDWVQFIVRLDKRAVERQLASMLGQPLGEPLRFANSVDLSIGMTESLKYLLQYLVHDLGSNYSLLSSGATANPVEQLLISTLLNGHEHNYKTLLQAPVELLAPRYVRRAKEYMMEHLADNLDINELASVTGVSRRSLHKAFQRYCGTSPMAWFKYQKILAVHNDLLAAKNGETVTDIALRWGFHGLGKFAADYREVHGQLPSETLRH